MVRRCSDVWRAKGRRQGRAQKRQAEAGSSECVQVSIPPIDLTRIHLVYSLYMQTFSVSSSDIQKHYRQVLERVKQTKQRAVLTHKNEPQAVIISLEEAQQLDDLRRRNSGKNLLAWAKDVRELLKDEKLPADLSTRHDYYLWEEDDHT
jgi:prevent-host-death family protein